MARIRRAYKVAQQQKERDEQAEEARASAERESRLRIIDRLLDGFSLWHMTHLSNLPSFWTMGYWRALEILCQSITFIESGLNHEEAIGF